MVFLNGLVQKNKLIKHFIFISIYYSSPGIYFIFDPKDFDLQTMALQEKLGIDERINEAFQPISNFWEGLILHEFFGTGIPTIIFLFYKKNKMINLTSEELIEILKKDKNSYLLDVRTDDEFEDSHIPNSKLLNIKDPQLFMDGIQKLDKTKNYYVYCHSGVRSVQACQIMKSFGFENLYNLLGGISEWTGPKI